MILGVGCLVGVAGLALSLHAGLDARGAPLGADFVIFYGASGLALKGEAVRAWSAPAILAAQRAVFPAGRGLFLWCYPPSFLLLVAPLARLPYLAALGAWTAVTGGAYLAMTRLISRARGAAPLALAFPGVFVCVSQGQNGLLTAAVLGAGLLLLDRRPLVAGAVLGLIVYKPHFGVLLPLLLFGTGRWRAALATGTSAAALVLLSAAAFGVESWRAFLDNAPLVRAGLETGALPLAKAPTVFAALRLLGAPLGAAYAAQAAAALLAAGLALVGWGRPGPLPLKAGLAVSATLLATPYAFDYDLVVLAVPIGVLAAEAGRRRLPDGTAALLAAAALSPLLAPQLARFTGLQIEPLVVAALFGATLRALAPERGAALVGAPAPA